MSETVIGHHYAVLHETTSGIEGSGQTYQLLRTHQLTLVVEEDGGPQTAQLVRKVRVTVHVDDYVHQCRYRSEVWTAGGWAEVVRIDGGDPAFSTMERSNRRPLTSGYTRNVDDKVAFLDKVAAELLERTVQVLS